MAVCRTGSCGGGGEEKERVACDDHCREQAMVHESEGEREGWGLWEAEVKMRERWERVWWAKELEAWAVVAAGRERALRRALTSMALSLALSLW